MALLDGKSSPKMFASQLEKSKVVDSGFQYLKLDFEVVWVQGVVTNVIEDDEVFELRIDDGTGCIVLVEYKAPHSWEKRAGQYILVVGRYQETPEGQRLIEVFKVVDLSDDPNRETLWYLEVVDLHQYLEVAAP